MRGSRLGIITYGSAAGTIDLGNEPPLLVGEDEEADKAPIPRAVSWRWLTGTVLTGVTSIFLMGAALMAALSNPNQFASLPDSFAAVLDTTSNIIFGEKGDRLNQTDVQVATTSRQIVQVSTATRQGQRDFFKLEPFVKIHAVLGSASPDIVAKVPTYDPLKIFADTSAPDAPDAADATDDGNASVATTTPTDSGDGNASSAAQDAVYGAAVAGDVSIKASDFPVANADLEPTVAFDDAEVEQIVRAFAHLGDDDTSSDAVALDDNGDPTTGAGTDGVKIVQENVSSIVKSTDAALDDGYQEKIIAVDKPENLRALFQDNAISGDDADEIIAALSQLVDVSRLRPGQKIRIAFATDPSAAALDTANSDDDTADTGDDQPKSAQSVLRPIRVSIYDNGAHQATVARADNNAFVRADEPSATPELYAEAPAAPAPDTSSGPPKLYDAIYETALAQQVPPDLIDDLIRAFAYDVDYTTRIAPGDSMEIFHSMPDPADKDAGDGQILYASLTIGGVERRLYRFTTPDDGVTDYYDEDGRSAKKFLVRKPLTVNARISSPFGWRVHPILGYKRLHPGVDYAAPKGTPILAAGNGVVERAGPSNGYGNFTLIKHTNGYETAYGHQTAFAKGIKPGVVVHQGQIIGYVGSTGLSTGPHLHFEIRVNGQPVDPLRVRLPRGRTLDGANLDSFEKERSRIDALFGNAPPAPQTVASLTQ
ncbi:MAG TPA: M23 family metallopeptidase [Bauldia sp.]|nr:M23 family metallopeptidase [Bauldia sp.]